MADDIHDLNKNTPATPSGGRESDTPKNERSHRRVEKEANKLAERGKERDKKNDDLDEFSNIGPV